MVKYNEKENGIFLFSYNFEFQSRELSASTCPAKLFQKRGKKNNFGPYLSVIVMPDAPLFLPSAASLPPQLPRPGPFPLRRRPPHPSPVTPTCRRPLLTLFATARAAEGCLRSEERMLSPPTGGPECCLLLLFLSIRFAAIEFVHDLVLFHQGFSRYGAAAGGRLLR